LVKAVRKSGKTPEQLAIISFKDDSIAEAKRLMPEIQAYYLSSFRQDKETKVWTHTAEELIAKAKALGADGLDLAEKGPIDAEFVRKVKAAGLGMYIWTVDDLGRARDFVKMGVDGITTNRAAWLSSHLNPK
ncbi:MAG: glycerophosphodiester phosphodiesterase family protein, partial [Isosphaeraceae bacterium]